VSEWEGLPTEDLPAIAELARYNQWVAWKIEPSKGTGEPTKVPYNPITGGKASVTNQGTWGSFAQAYQACQENVAYSGIGFVLTELDPFVGVDLDKCINPETREIEAWAQAFIDKLESYTEISPRGIGLRIITKGLVKLPRKRKGRLEIYQDRRYLTLTGNNFKPWKDTIATTADRLKGVFDNDDESSNDSTDEVITAEAEKIRELEKELAPFISEDAEPSSAKLEALFENCPEFKVVWEHDKKGTEEWSQSEWDLSITNYLIDANWPNNEIVAALILQRRRYKTDLKLRADYYARTLIAAQRGREAQQAQENLSRESLEVLKPDELAEHILGQLSEIYGFKFVRFIKYNSEPPEYAIVTELGSTTGSIDILIAQATFRKAIAQACGIVTPMVKAKQWDERSQSMLNVLEEVDVGEEATGRGFGVDLLRQYLENRPTPKEFNAEAGEKGDPYIEEDRIHVFSFDLRKFLNRDLGVKMANKQLGVILRQADCRPRSKTFVAGEKRLNRSIWKLPEGFS